MNMNNDKAETSYSVLNDPSLSGIPHEKIVFLEKMLFEAKTKSQSELLPFFLNPSLFSTFKQLFLFDRHYPRG